MGEPRTQCVACGRRILQRTADRYGGLCVPCHNRAAAIPPDDFSIPRKRADRILSMDEDPAFYKKIVWQQGVAAAISLLDQIEERNELYTEWSHKLREFAERCRGDNPCPDESLQPRRDFAKLPIFEAKIRSAARFPRLRKTMVICRLPLFAIPSAQRLWPGRDDRCICLTPDEDQQWGEIYSHSRGSFEWFLYLSWEIQHSFILEFHH